MCKKHREYKNRNISLLFQLDIALSAAIWNNIDWIFIDEKETEDAGNKATENEATENEATGNNAAGNNATGN